MSDTRLFVYGTLRDAEVFARVAGQPQARFAPQPARLAGYRALYARGASFPILVQAPGHVAEGLLMRGLPSPVWQRLDAFEGPPYYRARLQVAAGGRRLFATVYLSDSLAATPRPFRLADWRARHKAAYLARALP